MPPSPGMTAPFTIRDSVRREEERDIGDVLGLADAERIFFEGADRAFSRAFLVRLAVAGADALGQDEAGADNIGAHALVGIGAGERACEGDQPAFRRRIDMRRMVAAQRHHGRDVDDGATAARDHVRHDMPAHQHRPLQVERDGAVPDAEIDIMDRRVLDHRPARAVEQDVDAPELGHRRRRAGGCRGIVGHVGAVEGGARLCRRSGARRFVDLRHHHFRALANEDAGRGPGDPGPGAGDDRGLAFQTSHLLLSSRSGR